MAEKWADVLPAGERSWLDDRVPDRRTVTALVAVEEYADLAPRDGFYLTEFFNSSLARAATVGTPQDSLPTERVAVRPDGSVRLESGKPLVADLVLAQHGVELEGRSVAEGTAARLTLWDTAGGPVLLVGVASAAELVAAACGRG